VFDDIAGRSVEDVFMDISKAVEEGRNQANLLADMQTLMGRGSQPLIPVFQSNFSGMMEESRKIGAPLSSQQVSEMGQTADALTKSQQSIGAQFGKAFSNLSKLVEDYGALVTLPFSPEFAKSNRSIHRLQEKLDSKLLEKIERNTRETADTFK